MGVFWEFSYDTFWIWKMDELESLQHTRVQWLVDIIVLNFLGQFGNTCLKPWSFSFHLP